jgi:hypothetical protein
MHHCSWLVQRNAQRLKLNLIVFVLPWPPSMPRAAATKRTRKRLAIDYGFDGDDYFGYTLPEAGKRRAGPRGVKSSKAPKQCSILRLEQDLLLRLIVLPHLDQLEKLTLQTTCSAFGQLMNSTAVWQCVDVSYETIGRHKTQRGRSSNLTPLPAFLRCKAVLEQKRQVAICSDWL